MEEGTKAVTEETEANWGEDAAKGDLFNTEGGVFHIVGGAACSSDDGFRCRERFSVGGGVKGGSVRRRRRD